jgi:protein arginine kinase activator
MEEVPENQNHPGDTPPERPLECSECKKQIDVHYTEIERGQFHETSMCNDCPELHKKLRGVTLSSQIDDTTSKTKLTCGDCGTSLEEIRVGHPLGCSHCYEVFADTIIYELYSMGKIPEKLDLERKSSPLHLGRAPGESLKVNPSLKLIALNEALDDTLKREDYEQAALLRDQINALTEKSEQIEGQKIDEPE